MKVTCPESRSLTMKVRVYHIIPLLSSSSAAHQKQQTCYTGRRWGFLALVWLFRRRSAFWDSVCAACVGIRETQFYSGTRIFIWWRKYKTEQIPVVLLIVWPNWFYFAVSQVTNTCVAQCFHVDVVPNNNKWSRACRTTHSEGFRSQYIGTYCLVIKRR